MRILLSNPLLAHGAFHHWMTADLVALGHQVSFLDPDDLCEQYGIDLYRRILLQRVAAERPDVFIVYPPYDLLRPREVQRLHELGTAVVGFAYDDPLYLPTWLRTAGQFERILDEYRRTYDVYVTTSRQMAREAAGRGHDWIRPIRWAINTPAEPDRRARDLQVVVIGAGYPRRVNMVRHLRKAGIRPVIFGAQNWRQFGDVVDDYKGMLTRPGMFDIYRRAQIALAPADWESSYSPMVKLRTLEIVSCGTFQLVEQAEDLADYYREGEEIVSYRDWDQLVELIRKYSQDEAQRQRIARAGYERTLRDHVWKVRWAEVAALVQPVIESLQSPAASASPQSAIGNPQSEISDLKSSISDPPPADPHLAHEMSLSATAAHYERSHDIDTATVAYNEWELLHPGSFNLQLGKGRILMGQRRFAEAEPYMKLALEAGRDLCPLAIDATVTQRKLGPRLGLGQLFTGIFPRTLEPSSHLLIIYANMDRPAEAEALLAELSRNQDMLFVSIVAILAEPNADKILPPKYMARYVEALLGTQPFVWLGELERHRAHFQLMRAGALLSLGRRPEARQLLRIALSCAPSRDVEAEIRKQLAALEAQDAPVTRGGFGQGNQIV